LSVGFLREGTFNWLIVSTDTSEDFLILFIHLIDNEKNGKFLGSKSFELSLSKELDLEIGFLLNKSNHSINSSFTLIINWTSSDE
jgi:hypothetical protein